MTGELQQPEVILYLASNEHLPTHISAWALSVDGSGQRRQEHQAAEADVHGRE